MVRASFQVMAMSLEGRANPSWPAAVKWQPFTVCVLRFMPFVVFINGGIPLPP